MSRKSPELVDKIIGRNVRVYRLAKGLSQTELAKQLGIAFQQVQKYEKSANRIGCGRLLRIAQITEADISAFFEGCDQSERVKTGLAFDELANPESFRLLDAFSKVRDRQIRLSLVDLVESIVRSAS